MKTKKKTPTKSNKKSVVKKSKKTTQKPSKNKTTKKKVVKKTVNKKIVKSKKPKATQKPFVTMVKFRIIGYGSEIAWMELDKDQFNYWREIFDKADDQYDAKRELIDHVRSDGNPDYGNKGYLGRYYDWNAEFEEYPFYQGSIIQLELYSGEDLIETIELPLEDKSISKIHFDGFIDKTKKQKKYSKGTVFAKTEDRGEYCIGEFEIEEGEEFSINNLTISVENIQGYQYVSMVEYDDMSLMYESADDPYNKDFDAWIVWS